MLSLLLYVAELFTLAVLATQQAANSQSTADLQLQRSLRDEATTRWPSLRFHFKVKRSSMDIYGQTEFAVLASPTLYADESRVLYDVSATFQEGKTMHNYTLVDGVAHLTSTVTGFTVPLVQCLRSELNDFPPINAIISSVNEAMPMSRVSSNFSGASKCGNGDLFEVKVSALDFALCASSNSSFEMYGRDMDIVVEYLKDHVDIVAPEIEGDSDNDLCDAEVVSYSVTPTGRALLTGEPIVLDESRKLGAEFSLWSDDDEDEDDSCSCKSTPRPCIFIHGLGVKGENPQLQDSLPYWGQEITNHAPCCTTITFAHLNTVNYTWVNATQQQKVCDRALMASNTSTDVTISDTIVVTHSMGSLMLAAAMANGRCKLDMSSTWVSSAAPMIGSMASDYAQEVCAGETNVVAEELAEFKNQCPVNTATKSLAYEGEDYSSGRLNLAYKAAQEAYRTNVSAVMCSASFSGILSSYQASFWVLGEMIPHKSKENDGTVEFQSCAKGLPESKFGDSYTDRFYRTKLNHYDMQFRAGDAFWNEAKMPVKWFECLL